jgi:hypothetical protein
VKLVLTRTGGVAGLRLEASIDAADLPPRARGELLRLVEAAGLFTLRVEPSAIPAAPDRFRYRLVVEDGARRCDLRVAEDALPEGLRRLVRWVEGRAGPARR